MVQKWSLTGLMEFQFMHSQGVQRPIKTKRQRHLAISIHALTQSAT